MRNLFLQIFCILFGISVNATQLCRTDSIPASTPDSQFINNNDGTITDLKTGLMWKKCLEGFSGSSCESGSMEFFTWQQALQQPKVVNSGDGLAGYHDWRIPNIRELRSIVEEQCYHPAININRFPNTPDTYSAWSGTPYNFRDDRAWTVYFGFGDSYLELRSDSFAVRLVRGGN
jgi:hypothetical protein